MRLTEWQGCYDGSWKGIIVEDAFAHPAKFSRQLIGRIYRHLIDSGYVKVGDTVVDPFGGVALGALDAMANGLHWIGCELELKFHALGNKNLDQWRRFAHSAGWGTARLLQGDSRRLVEIVRAAGCVVSSPPYAELGKGVKSGEVDESMWTSGSPNRKMGKSHHADGYGQSPGQLGSMPSGDVEAVLGSPPFTQGYSSGGGINVKGYGPGGNDKVGERTYQALGGDRAAGNLETLPMGSVADSIVTSPPYNPPMSQDHNGTKGGKRGTEPSEPGAFVRYGNTEGQIEGLPMGSVADAVCSSPPYEGIRQDGGGDYAKQGKGGFGLYTGEAHDAWHTTRDQTNLGNNVGETFWAAAKQIIQQCHAILKPGGVAVWVCKDFVRNKARVPFSDDWRRLCEACGFITVEWIKASLVKEWEEATLFNGTETKRRERKSFFRRLAEKKGSPRIDHEDVLVMKRSDPCTTSA